MRCTNKKRVIGIILFLFISLFIIQAEAASNKVKPSLIEIDIHKGDTLSNFCVQYFGHYNNALIKKILKVNPQISNPDIIYEGKKLKIPSEYIKAPLKLYFSVLKNRFNTELPYKMLIKPAIPAHKCIPVKHPILKPQTINYFRWIDDNTAIVKGSLSADAAHRFFVDVPGDLEYEQKHLKNENDGTFRIEVFIGRKGKDYGKEFILKLVMFDKHNERIGGVSRTILRKHHKNGEVVWGPEKAHRNVFTRGPTGWPGVKRWINTQKSDASKSDNSAFRVSGGLLVSNYRYHTEDSDEKYLNWYGRTTLYGSACLAKALLLANRIIAAEQIIRVWAAQINEDGKIPRSANVVGDNYIDYDVRTGEVAHFLGAMAVAKKMNAHKKWDEAMKKIVYQYLKPLINKKSGLIHGGYDAQGSNGYNKPYGYTRLKWCSAEHNFDVFQALILISRLFSGSEFGRECHNIALTVAKGINTYLWDSAAGTFNRGWHEDLGTDHAKALDCSAWGALFYLKQAILYHKQDNSEAAKRCIVRAHHCLKYAARNFKSSWAYKTPTGKISVIQGYRPYHGKIDDLRWQSGNNAGSVINWDAMNSMIWSEGTLGVAKAWKEFGRLTGSYKAIKYSRLLHGQMLKLQSLSDQGGLLYTTEPIKGHFAMREDLASLSWLAYFDLPTKKTAKNKEIIGWMPW
jgi:phage tail protein X